MKYTYIILLVNLLFSSFINAQKIKFKDENFKSALLELGYDFNKDNEIQISEIDTVVKLKVSKKKIKVLDDLVHFKKLKMINAMTNQITSLDVFNDNSTIEEIYIGENQLGKKMILKNIKNLKGLYAFRNGIEEINFIGTDNIESLYLQGNLFERIEFKNLTKLSTLQLSENEKLKEINVSNNKELAQLYLTDTAILKLDITNNPLLKTLYVEKKVRIEVNGKQSDFKPMPIIQISK
ncbi:hypothetical protein E6C50_08180 [Flavobacterium supellecticarium]|uniref:Leucine-rich repeat domain-containing protein n=1 Tax=Flavobacterium supellecticarium TaxID=2565924 RepID=A0A4S4A0F1_9FLAO|nr:hypothetical protein [Flavobacterium supellecticarium]THF51728.1 hypothetical protein E6C50_08180 [Flavobacterium supellecticarium]